LNRDLLAAVRLSDLRGLPVVAGTGRRVGRLADVTVRLGAERPRVHRLLVRDGRSTAYLVDAEDVVEIEADRIVIGSDPEPVPSRPTQPPLQAAELLLARDVLDTQVVDLRGRRLSRVSEVLLGRRSSGDLEVIGVDLGVAALLRRIGRRRGLHPPDAAALVAWPDLHLTSRRGHVTQLSADAAAFRRLDAHGLAALLARLSTPKAVDVIHATDPARSAAAIHHSHPHTGRRLVHALSPSDRRRLLASAERGHADTITELGRQGSPLRRHRFLRTAGWRLHRPPES
jgi:sporulation protein YlmC with PRC-barrel domain